MKYIEKIKITLEYSLLEALKLMDSLNCKLLIVMSDNKFLSVLSIGDIQRALINKTPLDSNIKKILRKDFSVASNRDSIDKIKKQMLDLRIECMPVIDKNNNLIKVYFWEDFFSKTNESFREPINLPIVIMAGGKGTRLKPLTNILPKPLIPIGDKTIIEEIISRFINIGSKNFHVSLFYKAKSIINYFSEIKNKEYKIDFFKEDKPLGTAGSLFLLKNKINKTFFVTNCDIIIDQDYRDIYEYHKKNKNQITIVSALSHYLSPYGIIETGKDGRLISITEKPEITYNINSGMYLLEPELLDDIPNNKFFHITTLIEKIKKSGGKIGVFPVSEKSWIDIGDWKKYIDEIKVI